MAKQFKRRELELEEEGALILNEDGSIDYVDDDGNTENSWATTDPEWPNQAQHFGLTLADLPKKKKSRAQLDRHHATKKKTPAQLQREIDEVLEGDPGMRCDRLVREVRELEALADDGRLGYRARGGRGSTSANELYHASLRALGLTKGALKRGDCTDAEVNLERAYRYFHKAEGLAGPTEPIPRK
jgi:hypothetical protein